MKKSFFKLTILLVMVCFASLPVVAQVVSIESSEGKTEIVSPAVGEQFEVSVKITEATNLYAFAANLKFDPNAVEVATVEDNDELVVGEETSPQEAEPEPLIKPGGFLNSDGNPTMLLLPKGVDNEAGLIDGLSLLRVNREGVPESREGLDGDGVLLTITFKVKSVVESDLVLQNVQLFANDEKTTAQSIPMNILTVEKGDVNLDGKVKSSDAFLALRIAVGLVEATVEQKLAADMNDDGKVKSSDAFAILRKAVGLGAPALVVSHAAKAVKISTSKVEGIAGDNVRVLLTVDKPEAIGSADINIAYEPTILTATNVETPQNSLWAVNLNKRGQIRLATANLEISKESVLATIYFKVLRNEQTVLELRRTEAFGFDTLPLTVTKVNGEFTSPLIVPDRNLLKQNFPNPFNPETWMPYQLKDASQVVITIYDVSGRTIRKFDLGYQPAGIYSTRAGAVHWDGCNDAGEDVTSGIYFYTLKTKAFTQTRRMLLLK